MPDLDDADHRRGVEPVIYWIGGKKRGPVKIGFTSSVGGAESRLSSLQTGNPEELVVLGSVPGSQRGEHMIHRALSGNRVRGEWFERKPAIALLEALDRGDVGHSGSNRGLDVSAGRRNGNGDWVGELSLYWEPEGSSMSGDYKPSEISAQDLYLAWKRKYVPSSGVVPIFWYIDGRGFFEAAPVGNTARHTPNFISNYYSYFHHPFDASNQVVSWLDLPVQDQFWNDQEWGGAGFIQELTGWKPSPFQQFMDVDVVSSAFSIQA